MLRCIQNRVIANHLLYLPRVSRKESNDKKRPRGQFTARHATANMGMLLSEPYRRAEYLGSLRTNSDSIIPWRSDTLMTSGRQSWIQWAVIFDPRGFLSNATDRQWKDIKLTYLQVNYQSCQLATTELGRRRQIHWPRESYIASVQVAAIKKPQRNRSKSRCRARLTSESLCERRRWAYSHILYDGESRPSSEGALTWWMSNLLKTLPCVSGIKWDCETSLAATANTCCTRVHRRMTRTSIQTELQCQSTNVRFRN